MMGEARGQMRRREGVAPAAVQEVLDLAAQGNRGGLDAGSCAVWRTYCGLGGLDVRAQHGGGMRGTRWLQRREADAGCRQKYLPRRVLL